MTTFTYAILNSKKERLGCASNYSDALAKAKKLGGYCKAEYVEYPDEINHTKAKKTYVARKRGN